MYTIREASTRAGISVEVARAWERRYGIVRPERTAAGYRLYDDAAVARLRAMQRLVAEGRSPSLAARQILDADAAGLPVDTGRGPADAPASGPIHDPRGRLVELLVEAARTLDPEGMEAALDEAFAIATFEVVAHEVLMPAMVAAGSAWEDGSLDVAGEHALSAAVMRRLAAAFQAAGSGTDRRPIVVGMAPGERHELGALAFAIAARRGGLDVVYLGADVPAASWVEACRRSGAVAAVVGSVTVESRVGLRAVVRELRALSEPPLVAVGGRGAERLVARTGLVLLPHDIGAAVAALTTLLPVNRDLQR